jgi:hypothetical protein
VCEFVPLVSSIIILIKRRIRIREGTYTQICVRSDAVLRMALTQICVRNFTTPAGSRWGFCAGTIPL